MGFFDNAGIYGRCVDEMGHTREVEYDKRGGHYDGKY